MCPVMLSHRNNRKHPGVRFVVAYRNTTQSSTKAPGTDAVKDGPPNQPPSHLADPICRATDQTPSKLTQSIPTCLLLVASEVCHRRQPNQVVCSERHRHRRKRFRPKNCVELATSTLHALLNMFLSYRVAWWIKSDAVVATHWSEGISSCSELLSLHCLR